MFTESMLVTTTYLEQLDPSQLKPAREPEHPATVIRVDEPSPEFARFLYTAVGGDWTGPTGCHGTWHGGRRG